MANSTIRIIFSELADPAGTGLLIQGQVANFTMLHNTTINIAETFIKLRTQPFQSTIAAPPAYTTGSDEKPVNLANALLTDYPSLFTAEIEGNDTVVLTSLFPNTIFTGGEDTAYLSYVVNNVTTPTTGEPMRVIGLNDDRFLINNPIHVQIGSLENPTYFKLRFTNLSNQIVSTDFICYPNNNGYCDLWIESIIKSIFDYPSDADGYTVPDQLVKNSNKIKIQMYYNGFNLDTEQNTGELLGFETVKTFIRGGKRKMGTNLSLPVGIINLAAKLPVWDDYDTAEYYIDENNLIRKRLLLDVPSSRIDRRRSKGCNEVYVKFKNQNGGYSNWMFESFDKKETNTNLGGFIRNNVEDDLGNESDNKVSIFAKIPKEYKAYVNDLIVSEEIHIMNDGILERARSAKNTAVYDNIKRSYSVTLNFELDYRFKPALR